MSAVTKKAAAKPAAKSAAKKPARVVGQVVSALLAKLTPNAWNPNRMTEFQLKSFRAGLEKDGWLASQALLVWRTDEKGAVKNVIIDGEHRWKVAQEIGFTAGPTVFLDGLTEKQAIELTIGLDNKRGQFDPGALRDAINRIGAKDEGLAFRLGFDDDAFRSLLSPLNVLPPGDFREVSVDAATDYKCPKCGYEWRGGNGASKGDKAKK